MRALQLGCGTSVRSFAPKAVAAPAFPRPVSRAVTSKYMDRLNLRRLFSRVSHISSAVNPSSSSTSSKTPNHDVNERDSSPPSEADVNLRDKQMAAPRLSFPDEARTLVDLGRF